MTAMLLVPRQSPLSAPCLFAVTSLTLNQFPGNVSDPISGPPVPTRSRCIYAAVRQFHSQYPPRRSFPHHVVIKRAQVGISRARPA